MTREGDRGGDVSSRLSVYFLLGSTAKDFRGALGGALHGLRPSSPGCRALCRMLSDLDSFRSVMDDEACRLVPLEMDPHRRVLQIFYGEPLTDSEKTALACIANGVRGDGRGGV